VLPKKKKLTKNLFEWLRVMAVLEFKFAFKMCFD